MRILVVTDTFEPQVNGVARTYKSMKDVFDRRGHQLFVEDPTGHPTFPCPTYPELRLALARPQYFKRKHRQLAPDHIHIATEGPMGLAARMAFLDAGVPFTTTYHTRFPEYVRLRFLTGAGLVNKYQRRFHNAAAGMMIRSRTLATELAAAGFRKLMPWHGGVDHALFRPRTGRIFGKGPIFLYVGRLAIEKNISAFLSLQLPGTKVVVGDGPARTRLQRRHPDALFLGQKTGEDLARCYAAADVFVFPSRTDTCGLAMLEAMASGLPVAGFKVPGPLDIVAHGISGYLNDDLQVSCKAALDLDPTTVRTHALPFSWDRCAETFLRNIALSYQNNDAGHARQPLN